jgi:ATP-dependent protease HslVU (ClpYQ) peptidase subunit
VTIVIGIPHDGRVYLGADTQATGDNTIRRHHEPKVWRAAGMVFGLAGSPRERQIIQYATTIPPRSGKLHAWLCTDFVAAIRRARRSSGYDEMDGDGTECGPNMMIGVEGRLFVMYSDYQVSEFPLGAAIGSAEDVALGAMFATRGSKMAPRRRVEVALQAACTHDTYCSPPFKYISGA